MGSYASREILINKRENQIKLKTHRHYQIENKRNIEHGRKNRAEAHRQKRITLSIEILSFLSLDHLFSWNIRIESRIQDEKKIDVFF